MKKCIKNNILAIVLFSIFIFIFLFACFKSNAYFHHNKIREKEQYTYCQNIMQDNIFDDNLNNYCQNVISYYDNTKISTPDIYTGIYEVLMYHLRNLNPIYFLIISIPTLYNVCRILKNKYIINFNTRDSFKKYKRCFFKEAYKYWWFIPLLFIIVFIYGRTMFPYTYEFSVYNGNLGWTTTNLIYHPNIFFILFFIYILAHSFIFLNICLLVARKVHKFFPAIILSYITYCGIELFLEVVLSPLVNLIFRTDIGHTFKIMTPFTFSIYLGEVSMMIFIIVILILSSLAVYLSYNNKEKLVIDCEKNN